MNRATHQPGWAHPDDDRPRRGGRGRRRGGGGGPGGGRGRGYRGAEGVPGRGPGRGRGRGRARRGDVRLAVLALLAEEPRNGYQVIQEIDARTEGAWKPSPGAIYPALNQLEDEGLIVPTEAKTFTVTEAGRAAAAEIDPKPWEVVNREMADACPDGAARVCEELRRLNTAVESVLDSGTEDDLTAAVDLLTETRRRLFGLLAADR